LNVDADRKPTLAKRLFGILVKTFLVLIMLCVILGLFLSSTLSWPILKAFEQKKIYAISRNRIEKAGGWKAVEQVCLNFATNEFNPNEPGIYYLHGNRFSTNSLPQLTAVRFRNPVNIDGFRCLAVVWWVEVEQAPVKWAFSQRA